MKTLRTSKQWVGLFLLVFPGLLFANPWKELAEKDLRFIHSSLSENHPGAVDKENPFFKIWLEKGLKESLELAGKGSSYGSYRRSLLYYINGFQDSHLGISFNLENKKLLTCGVILGFENGNYFVDGHISPDRFTDLPAIGSKLLSCDGLPPLDILKERVLPYWGIESLESSWSKLTPWAFVEEKDFFPNRIQTCTFFKNSQQTKHKLKWISLPHSQIGEAIKKINYSDLGLSRIRELPGKAGYWVHLPRFEVSGSEREALRKVLDEFRTRPAKLRKAPLIVFDVRGNSGGNSAWGSELAELFWGPEFLEKFREEKPQVIEYRISPTNITQYQRIVDQQIQDFGPKSADTVFFQDVLKNMLVAQKEKREFYTQSFPSIPRRPDALKLSSPVQGKVILLTDGTCVSACLDFADTLLSIPGVVHVGKSTAADTAYMEVNSVELLSKLGDLNFPTKVYRHKKRKDNEPYVPLHRYSGKMNSSAALEKWILENAKRW